MFLNFPEEPDSLLTCNIEILILVLDMWHGCYLEFMYCMVISSFPVAVFTAMWQKQFLIKKQERKPSWIPDSCFKVWTHEILYNSDFVLVWDEFLTCSPKIQLAQQFFGGSTWAPVLSSFSWNIMSDFYILCHNKACCTKFCITLKP